MVKEYKLPVIRLTSSGDLIYSMMNIVNLFYCVIYFKVTKRADLKCSQHTHTQMACDRMEVLANAMVVIILQCLSNQHIRYLKLTCYVSIYIYI